MRCRHYIDSELGMLENKIKIQCKLKSVSMELSIVDGDAVKKCANLINLQNAKYIKNMRKKR